MKSIRTSHRTGVSTFASRTSPSTDQSLQKSFHLSHAEKIELKKISSPSENKKYATAQTDTTKTDKPNKNNGLQGRPTRTTGYNIGFAREQVKCFVSNFLLNLNFVLRWNFCAKNLLPRKAENR